MKTIDEIYEIFEKNTSEHDYSDRMTTNKSSKEEKVLANKKLEVFFGRKIGLIDDDDGQYFNVSDDNIVKMNEDLIKGLISLGVFPKEMTKSESWENDKVKIKIGFYP